MLPGKKLTPDDILRAVMRRKWVILIPFVVIAIGVSVWSSTLHPVYESEAIILVLPQRVPEKFVQSTITAGIEDRLQTIAQQILSRTRLERIIEEFGLYSAERKSMIMQDVVDAMRVRDITVDVPKARRRRDDSGTSFRLAFRSDDPRKAMNVTERLSSVFIEENLRERELLAEGTDQFLESQLEEAKRQLLETEKKQEDYRRANMGQLPTQLQTNLQVLQNTQQQLQTIGESIARDRDQKTILERMLADVLATPPQPGRIVTQSGNGREQTPVLTPAQQLEQARTALAALQLRLKPEHPDVVRGKRVVRDLEAKAAADAAQTPLSPDGSIEAGLAGGDPARTKRIQDLRQQIASLDAQVLGKQREEARLKGQIGLYQARVEAAPLRESELVAITRDYQTLSERYQSLLSKREDAKIAANLERRQVGETFKMIDPPRLPERPISPDLVRINMMGALAGLGLGVLLAAFLEYRDTAFRTEEDVLTTLALPVLAMVPVMQTTVERHRQRKRRRMASFAAVTMVVTLGLAAVLAWKFGFLRLGV